MSELVKRTLVGIIGIPIGLLIIYFGSYYFFGAILIISVIGLWEFYRMTEAKGWSPLTIPGIAAVIVFEATIYYYIVVQSNEFLGFLGIFNTLIFEIILFFFLFFIWNLFTSKENVIANISATLSGLIFILVSFTSLLLLRFSNNIEINDRKFFIIAYFVSIWICDSAAYFIGKKWGKHKVAPKVSPKKSWEGAIAGFIASILSFILLSYLFNFKFGILEQLSYGIVIGTIGQIGDFVESGFKRDAGVKDSSNLLSEHGGILDRFDSIMFTAPAVLLLNILFS